MVRFLPDCFHGVFINHHFFLMSATQRLTCCAAQLGFAINPPGTPQRNPREANSGSKGCPGEVQGTPEEPLEGTKNSVCAHTESRDPSETLQGSPRAAEALAPVGSRGTHISGRPRHSHQWAAEALGERERERDQVPPHCGITILGVFV